MRYDLIILLVLSALGAQGCRRAEAPGYLLLVIGAVIELLADSITMMAAGGLMVASGIALRGGRQNASARVAFGALFLFSIGASVVAAFTRADMLEEVRFTLGGVPPTVARGALVTVWMALVLRLVILPALLAQSMPVPAVVAIGPAWWSASVLTVRWGGVLPQDAVETCGTLCAPFAVVIVVAAGVWAFREGPWSGVIGATCAGVGALVAFGGWFGGASAVSGGRVLLGSTAVAGCSLAAAGSHSVASATVTQAIRLLLLGFPLGAGFSGRISLIKGVGGLDSFLGVAALAWWLLPLIGWIRHASPVPAEGRPRWLVWVALAAGLWGALEGGPLSPGQLLPW